MKQGKFIVFDGIGASGKDTQVGLLEEYLKVKKIRVLVTREHTRDTPIGVLIEKIIKKEADQIDSEALQLLFVSDRRNHYIRVIKPAIEKGIMVISNRYYPVNVAYSANEWRRKFLKINKMVVGEPDLVVIIDTPPKIAMERMNRRGDKDIFDKLEIMKKCQEGYRWYFKNSRDKCILVDGVGTKEVVFDRIIKEIKKRRII